MQVVLPWSTLLAALGLPTVPQPLSPAAPAALQPMHQAHVSPPPTLEGPWPVMTAGEGHSATPSRQVLVKPTRQVACHDTVSHIHRTLPVGVDELVW
jgi:hypothetical protein